MGFTSGKLFKMRFAAAFAATISLALLTSCGSSGGSTSIETPVQAATSYSNASVSGTYAFVTDLMIGTLTADGNGNITSGTMTHIISTAMGTSTPNCTISVTGTYTVQSSGAGTATLVVAAGGSNPCSSGGGLGQAQLTMSSSYLMEVAQQGSSFSLLNSDFAISATKQ